MFQHPGGSQFPAPTVIGAEPSARRRHRVDLYSSGCDAIVVAAQAQTPMAMTELPDDPRLGRRPLITALLDDPRARGFALEQWAPTLLASATWPDTTRRAALATAQLPFLARAEAVEQFPVPGRASVALPDDPRLGRRPVSFSAYPWLARGEAIEQWAIAQGAGCALPDDPRLGRRPLTFSTYPTLARGEALEQFAPTLLASITAPDRVWRATLPTAAHPAVFRAESLEQFAPTLLWYPTAPERVPPRTPQTRIEGLTYALQAIAAVVTPLSWLGVWPDVTRRAALATAEHPAWTAGPAIEQWSAPPLAWLGSWPDTTRRNVLVAAQPPPFVTGSSPETWALPPLAWLGVQPERYPFAKAQTRIEGLTYALQGLSIVVPPLAWLGTWPDTTRRLSLGSGQHPACVAGPAIEQWTIAALSWLNQYPDRVWASRLQPAAMQAAAAFADRDLAVIVPPLAWLASYPDTTRRCALHTSALPFVFRGEAVEQFRATLLWSVSAPDTTRRAVLPVAAIPVLFKAEAVEQFAPRLLWSATYPDTTRRASLPVSALPFEAVRGLSLEAWPPVLGAASIHPDRAIRAVLAIAQQLAHTTGTSPEGWAVPALAWLGVYPPTTRRDALGSPNQPAFTRSPLTPAKVAGQDWGPAGDPGWWHARPVQTFTTFAVTLVPAMGPGPRLVRQLGERATRAAALGERVVRGPLVAAIDAVAAGVRHETLGPAVLDGEVCAVAGVRDEQVEW